MAFSDHPKVDRFARNSEKAERKLRSFLNENAGFICRPEEKDYGCDFNVELVLNETHASNWRFQIQLKSIEKLTLVNDKKYISYQIETSRLSYLMKGIPSRGVIVLYSLEEDKCYYEFCDKIYTTLMSDRSSAEWKNNDQVNIHVPCTNVLDEVAAKQLHTTFLNRFQQATVMQTSHGPKYGLPIYEAGGELKYDFNNVDDIKRFLSDYGLMMLNNYDLGVLYEMIIQISNPTIYANRTLLWVAAVVYCECAMSSDSEIFCNKLGVKTDLTLEEKLMLQFLRLKNKAVLGYIDPVQFLDEMKNLDTAGTNVQNRIAIEISIVNYELERIGAKGDIPEHLTRKIEQIFSSIDKSDGPLRNRELLKIWNCENLSRLIWTKHRQEMHGFNIKTSLEQKIDVGEDERIMLDYIHSEKGLFKIIHEIEKFSNTQDDRFLKACILSFKVRHFIQSQTTMICFSVPVPRTKQVGDVLLSLLNFSNTAYDYFLSLHLYKEAYSSLCNTLEIIELTEGRYEMRVSADKDGLYSVKKKMETDFEISPVSLNMPGLISSSKKHPNDNLKDFNDLQLEDIAKVHMKVLGVPSERLENVIDELKAYRLIYQRCSDGILEIFQDRDPLQSSDEYYKEPVKFILLDKRTKEFTRSGTDVDQLLKTLNY